MSLLRTIMAVLIGFSLAVTPAFAAMAKPEAAMEHCDKTGTDAKKTGDQVTSDCCCDKANACPSDSCATKCFKTPLALSTANKWVGILRPAYGPSTAETVALWAWPPPAPPPRA